MNMALIQTTDCGDGFKIDKRPQATWVEWRAYQDDGRGYINKGRARNFSRRSDAAVQIEKWRKEDE
jgi:hypothetical protein